MAMCVLSSFKWGGDWMAPINSALNEVMTGQTDVKRALEKAQKEIDAKMK